MLDYLLDWRNMNDDCACAANFPNLKSKANLHYLLRNGVKRIVSIEIRGKKFAFHFPYFFSKNIDLS
jgi:hypothetical protein